MSIAKDKPFRKHGYCFRFTLAGCLIEGGRTLLSGKEYVKVNGETVSRKFSFLRESTHNFDVNGTKYELSFSVKSFLFGEVMCSLKENGKTLKCLLADPKIYEINIIGLLIVIACSFLYRLLAEVYDLPSWGFSVFIALAALVGFVFVNDSIEIIEVDNIER